MEREEEEEEEGVGWGWRINILLTKSIGPLSSEVKKPAML